LRGWDEMKAKAERGRRVVGDLYSKGRQWALFEDLLERV
jgi:hypothetical protein